MKPVDWIMHDLLDRIPSYRRWSIPFNARCDALERRLVLAWRRKGDLEVAAILREAGAPELAERLEAQHRA